MLYLNCTDFNRTKGDLFASSFSIYLEGVGIPLVGGFGILGNIVSVMVLR